MSTSVEQKQAIEAAVAAAERRLRELNAKPALTRAETFEREMTVDCIKRGKRILGKGAVLR